MKRLIFSLCSLLVLGGCAPASLPEVMPAEQQPAQAAPSADAPLHDAPPPAQGPREGDTVVDLTQLSSTMVYAEVYHMMMEPELYLGKTIIMRGTYASNYYDLLDQHYHFVVITDALACCAQGIEFVWGDRKPGEYPQENAEIEVSGVFKSYQEEEYLYFYVEADTVSLV